MVLAHQGMLVLSPQKNGQLADALVIFSASVPQNKKKNYFMVFIFVFGHYG